LKESVKLEVKLGSFAEGIEQEENGKGKVGPTRKKTIW
jgi:hypothetical protein